jgi:hypothetical protein
MKKLLALFFAFLFPMVSYAGSYWYQPTPYPTKVVDTLVDLEKVHIHDGWFSSSYPAATTLVRDGQLKFGGWGDTYRTYINFDLVGLPSDPTTVNLWMWNYSISGGNTTGFAFCIPSSNWNTSMTWSTQPSLLGCTGNVYPTSSNWNGANITSWYQNWKSGAWGKYGIMFNPELTNNNKSIS